MSNFYIVILYFNLTKLEGGRKMGNKKGFWINKEVINTFPLKSPR